MNDRPLKHIRRSIRLRGWDYSSKGYYFITLCIHDRWLRMFGEVVDGRMVLNECGVIIRDWIDLIPERYDGTMVDAFVVMPDHVHLIIRIISVPPAPSVTPIPVDPVGAIHELPLRDLRDPEINRRKRRIMTIPKIIGYYRMNTAKRINAIRGTPGSPVWQRNYWDHIIRDKTELFKIRNYIKNKPIHWEIDKLNSNCAREAGGALLK